jgi:hypothetical protein
MYLIVMAGKEKNTKEKPIIIVLMLGLYTSFLIV